MAMYCHGKLASILSLFVFENNRQDPDIIPSDDQDPITHVAREWERSIRFAKQQLRPSSQSFTARLLRFRYIIVTIYCYVYDLTYK